MKPNSPEKEQFMRAYRMCKSTKAIAAMLNVSRNHVLRLQRKYGLEIKSVDRDGTANSYANQKRPARRGRPGDYRAIQAEIDASKANFIEPVKRRRV